MSVNPCSHVHLGSNSDDWRCVRPRAWTAHVGEHTIDACADHLGDLVQAITLHYNPDEFTVRRAHPILDEPPIESDTP